jgi:flagellar biosynthesis protein FlhG
LEQSIPPARRQFSNNRLPYSIWAIGGGKGGIGKSLISANLAVTVAKLGYTVTLLDLDLGSANLHTCLGVPIPQLSLSDFFSGRIYNFQQIVSPTTYKNLSFVSGFNDALNVADLAPKHVQRLTSEIKQISSQIVILDLGAGTNDRTLDFFLMADRKITVIVPEPTSIENGYRFIKSAFYRHLRACEAHLGIQWMIGEAMDHKNKYGIRSPADLIKHITRQDPMAGKKLTEEMNRFYLDILINQVRTRSDLDLGHSIKSICLKYFGIESHYLGYLDHDNAAWQALRKKQSLVVEYPHCSLVNQLFSISKNLIDPKLFGAVV